MLFRERSLRVKNRMRVIRSSGSVRGGAGNIPVYSAKGVLDRLCQDHLRVHSTGSRSLA
jgi:hypothetical protein